MAPRKRKAKAAPKAAPRPRGGSKPRIGPVAVTARIELVVPPQVKARWLAAADAAGVTVSDLIRSAVDARIGGGDVG